MSYMPYGQIPDSELHETSIARVTYRHGNHRWCEDVEITGSIMQLKHGVQLEAETYGWRVTYFVPVQYGRPCET
jgi:hypothetical protein